MIEFLLCWSFMMVLHVLTVTSEIPGDTSSFFISKWNKCYFKKCARKTMIRPAVLSLSVCSYLCSYRVVETNVNHGIAYY